MGLPQLGYEHCLQIRQQSVAVALLHFVPLVVDVSAAEVIIVVVVNVAVVFGGGPGHLAVQ